MNNPIETAADLHREITRRGLELRPEVGRDAALVAELASKLGIPSTRFMSELEASAKTAEDYLRALMLVAEPFARMFREIWTYLAQHCAPRAQESLIIRFGFDGDNQEIDWDQFRVMVEIAKRVRSFGPVLLWQDEYLFDLGRLLTSHLTKRRYPRYEPGASFELKPIQIAAPLDEVGYEARALLQSLIDEIHAEWPNLKEQEQVSAEWEKDLSNFRDLPELQSIKAEGDPQPKYRKRSTRELAFLLTDLIPAWGDICEQWNLIPASDKRSAEHYFRTQIEPNLKSAQSPAWRRIKQALDLLDLPFWRYRWHTYEVWASVKALEALADFCPQPVVKDGHLALDAANPALIARLSAKQPIYAHVQGETKLAKPLGKRKAIKPDLRFSLNDPASNEATLSIVEYKQRRELDAKHAAEVLEAYSLGVGLGGGVVLINYDAIPKVAVPPLCILLGDVHPGKPGKVREYQTARRFDFCFSFCMVQLSKIITLWL